MSASQPAMAASAIALTQANLKQIAQGDVQVPTYDRNAVSFGVVHLGVGGFHRSHQAMYTDMVLASGAKEWGICGVGLMQHDEKMCQTLNAQDGLYTLLERADGQETAKIIGSIAKMIWGYNNQQEVIDQIASDQTKIVSLTVTEKGYCFDTKGELDFNHPFIQNDVQNPSKPQSALGFILAGLHARFEAGKSGITVMSCDNLPQNGDKTKSALMALAIKTNPELAKWIEANVTFPNSMVDRITPVTTPDIAAHIASEYNIEDGWPVVSETFHQWVIEDKFAAGRPAWEKFGAQFVKDVHPYELMKVRLLNGSHSALSYISYLCGYTDVDQAMADPKISQFVRAYMDEFGTATLEPVPGIDLDHYKTTLIKRFSNKSIKDKLLRLAEDGSQKIPNAILPIFAWHLENTANPVEATGFKLGARAIAAWFEFLAQLSTTLKDTVTKDPNLDALKAACASGEATKVLALGNIFGAVGQEKPLQAAIQSEWDALKAKGAKAVL